MHKNKKADSSGGNPNNSVNVKRIKGLYALEYEFISELIDKSHLPHKIDSDSEEETIHQNSAAELDKILMPKKTARAKTIAELHKRIEAIRDEKYTYKGKIIKKGLQNKLKRKKKILMNKTKRNALKKESDDGSKSIPNKLTAAVKPVFNKEGNLVFSKFDFLGETSTVLNDVKSLKRPSNIQQTLKKLEKTNNYIKRLENQGEKEKVNKLVEENTWANAFRKAEGIKVKDDPALLKKKLHKKESQKNASKKEWDNRKKTVEKYKLEKQQKRTENIAKRKQDNVKKKIKKAVKKGRYIPRKND